jgi:tRNA-splicing ligase RtcB
MSKKLSRVAIEATYDADEREYQRARRVKTPKKFTQDQVDALPVVRYTDGGQPVTMWTPHLDSMAWRQVQDFASLPFVHPKGLALMPDVHVGKGVCVGSVLPTVGALVPAAAGTDLGCGMLAVRLDLNARQLPDNLRALRKRLELRIPAGSGQSHREVPASVAAAWQARQGTYGQVTARHPRLALKDPARHLGTLGGGNHFVEISLDETSGVWIVIHSGSRGPGSALGQWFIDQAWSRAKAEGKALAHLGWFPESDPLFVPYVEALMWSQDFALVNRQLMLEAVMDALELELGRRPAITGEAINCHHNYVAREQHFGQDLWITRKGAIRAGVGEWGIIPGSMGAETYIVKGKGVAESYCSCAHGAGRAMTRTQARAQFTVQDLKKAVAGVECQVSKARVDEIPNAYKPIKQVMAHQQSLVEPLFVLKQVLCLKGD